jgi:dTDP-L-rhamnose 4-epimerase
MRILVTGGAGFIGSHIAARLVARGDDVRVLDSLHPAAHRAEPDVPGGVEFVRADVRDAATVRAALAGVDVIVHQAAMVGMGVDVADMPEYVGCNDLGTAVLLAAAAQARVSRLVLASSMVVYGEGAYECADHGQVRPRPRDVDDLRAGQFESRCPRCAAPLTPGRVEEDARLDPRSVYAATKLAQEHLCAAWTYATGGAVIALRYHNVYGPGMPRDTPYSGVAAIFRSALERGAAPRVFEDGGQRRDFIHVTDVARANVMAVDELGAAVRPYHVGAGFRPYNVATGRPKTVGDMAAALSRAFDGPAPVVTGQFRAGDVRHVVASPIRAARDLGFTATVDFAAGMSEFATAPLRGAMATDR